MKDSEEFDKNRTTDYEIEHKETPQSKVPQGTLLKRNQFQQFFPWQNSVCKILIKAPGDPHNLSKVYAHIIAFGLVSIFLFYWPDIRQSIRKSPAHQYDDIRDRYKKEHEEAQTKKKLRKLEAQEAKNLDTEKS